MPTPVVDLPGSGGDPSDLRTLFGAPPSAPPPPTVLPTLGTAPVVSSTPGIGQGVALDSGGRLNVVVSFLAVVTADPTSMRQGQFWYRSDLSKLSICVDSAGTVKRVSLT